MARPPRSLLWWWIAALAAVLAGAARASSGSSSGTLVPFDFTVNLYTDSSATASTLVLSFVARAGEIDGDYSNVITGVEGYLRLSQPEDACTEAVPEAVNGTHLPWISLSIRGNCFFHDKVYNTQVNGAVYALIFNNVSAADGGTLVTMGGSNTSEAITIPSAFLTFESYQQIAPALVSNGNWLFAVFLSDSSGSTGGGSGTGGGGGTGSSGNSLSESNDLVVFMFIPFLTVLTCAIGLFIVGHLYMRRLRRHHRVPHIQIVPQVSPAQAEMIFKSLPEVEVVPEDVADPERSLTCAICLDDFVAGNRIKRLPCGHEFHSECLQPWFTRLHHVCPTCKQDVGMKPIERRSTTEAATGGMVAIEMQQLADVPEDQAAGPAPSGPAQTFVDLGWTPAAAAAAGPAVEAPAVDPSGSGFTWLGASTSLLVPPPPPLDS